MRDYSQQAAVALGVYLERGRQALDSIERGEFDEAREILRWRNAAFHNFRVADRIAIDSGLDMSSEMYDIWQEITKVDEKLGAAMAMAKEDASVRFSRIRSARNKIRKYRSNTIDQSRFKNSA